MTEGRSFRHIIRYWSETRRAGVSCECGQEYSYSLHDHRVRHDARHKWANDHLASVPISECVVAGYWMDEGCQGEATSRLHGHLPSRSNDQNQSVSPSTPVGPFCL